MLVILEKHSKLFVETRFQKMILMLHCKNISRFNLVTKSSSKIAHFLTYWVNQSILLNGYIFLAQSKSFGQNWIEGSTSAARWLKLSSRFKTRPLMFFRQCNRAKCKEEDWLHPDRARVIIPGHPLIHRLPAYRSRNTWLIRRRELLHVTRTFRRRRSVYVIMHQSPEGDHD